MRVNDAAQKARKNCVCRFTAVLDRIGNVTVEISRTQANTSCFVFDENGQVAGARCKNTHPSAGCAALVEALQYLASSPLTGESATRAYKTLYAHFHGLPLGPHDARFTVDWQISALRSAGYSVYRVI